jgi:hypothetical protein
VVPTGTARRAARCCAANALKNAYMHPRVLRERLINIVLQSRLIAAVLDDVRDEVNVKEDVDANCFALSPG